MSNLLDEIDEHQDREVTLGTGALLGIFFAVVLICAVFFGLGYSLGRRSGEPATGAKTHFAPTKSAATDSSTNPTLDSSTTDKPSPTTESESPAKPITRAVPKSAPPRAEAPLAVVSNSAPAKQSSTPSSSGSGAPASGGQTMVQLMAAAQSEDADVLATALRKRGYHAVVRNEPDHLYHVQVGPFPSRAEADTMRRKLQADGYNAILK